MIINSQDDNQNMSSIENQNDLSLVAALDLLIQDKRQSSQNLKRFNFEQYMQNQQEDGEDDDDEQSTSKNELNQNIQKDSLNAIKNDQDYNIQQDLNEEVPIDPKEDYLNDLAFSTTVNKLCFEYNIFYQKNSKIFKKLDGKIYTLSGKYQSNNNDQMIDEQEEEVQEEVVNNSPYDNWIEKILKYKFLIILACFVVGFTIGWIIAAIMLIKHYNRYDEFRFYLIIFTIMLTITNFFFYLCLFLLLKQELQGELLEVAAIGLVELFVGCVHIIIIVSMFNSKQNYSDEFKMLNISPDLLFFEAIDRSKFSKFNIKKSSTLFYYYYQALDKFPQKPNFILKQKIKGENKVWNSGYFMLSDFTNFKNSQKGIKIFTKSAKIINFIIFLSFLIIPITFLGLDLQDTSVGSVSLLVFFFFLMFIKKIIDFLYQIYNFEIMDIFYLNILQLTSLIEPKRQFTDFEIQKDIPTLNIFCTQSIQTWKQIREIWLSFIQKCFIDLNQAHTFHIFIVVLCFTALIIDYKGFVWQQNYILESRFLMTYIILNITQKLLVSLVYTFNIFSSINTFMEYNNHQIYQTYQKLLYLKSIYPLLRQSVHKYLRKLLKQNNLQDIYQDFSEKGVKRIQETNFRPENSGHINENIRDDMKLQQIMYMKAIYEIQRNVLYYLNKTQDLNQKNKIELEQKYLTNLINVYKKIIEDMNLHKTQSKVKFLGIIPFEYGKLSAVVVIVLPALASYLIKQIID